MQDIKISVPATQVDSNGGDAVDSRTTPEPPVAISQKKTSKKKAAKSIFYSGSSNSQNNSLLVNVSNGLRSSTSKLDQINQANSAAVSPTAKASQLMPNFVKDNFVGKSVSCATFSFFSNVGNSTALFWTKTQMQHVVVRNRFDSCLNQTRSPILLSSASP